MQLSMVPWRTLLLILSISEMAFACSCAGERQACQAFGQSEAVFLGKVSAINEGFYNLPPGRAMGRRVTFDVLESFRGTGDLRIKLVTGIGGGDCGYPFKAGGVYLVYAYGNAYSTLETNICTRTAPVERAGDDLTFLRSLSAKGPEGRVFGYVASSRPLRWEQYTGKGAIAGVRVWLESNGEKLKTVTDSRGEYEFAGLLPGNYRIWADLPGLGGGEGRDVVLPSKACAQEVFIARELGSISGVIRNAEGQPAKNIWVELLRPSDRKRIGVGDGFTDENGNFTIQNVPQGSYLMGVHVRHTPSGTKYLWMPYERSYYPGAKDPDSAQLVTVESGQPVTGIDWKLGPALKQRVIRGIVLGPDDKPASPVFVELKVEGYEDNAALAETKGDGKFSLEGLIGLQYFIQASSGWREGSEAWHCHPLAVTGGDEPVVIKLDRPGKDCDECRKKK